MNTETKFNISKLLDDQPGLTLAPYYKSGLRLHGYFNFKASITGEEAIEDAYNLEIIVPEQYPFALPTVRELDNKIPKDPDYHVYSDDKSLCLGSPIRLLELINKSPDLNKYINKCLIPYLYAVSYKLKNGGTFIFGDLEHGDMGLLRDYSEIFSIKEPYNIKQCIKLLGIKKRIANKHKCPCGCGNRVGNCSFHNKLNFYRKIASRSWYRNHASSNFRSL